MRVRPESVTHLVVKLFNVKSKFASIMQTRYLCLFHTQVYCIVHVCIFPHVTQKYVVLTLSIPRYHLKYNII
jgi:hypothetical protein